MFLLQIAVCFLLLEVANANICQTVKCESLLEKCVGNTTHASCICKDGYYRTNSSSCEKKCNIHYCFNNGKCEQGLNGRLCRCVSPYHGSRCGNEETISIQIAVGASVMAAVLIVFLAVIIWRNRNENERIAEKAKKPWNYDEFQKSPDSFNFYEESTNSSVQLTSGDIENQETTEDPNLDISSSRHEAEVHITPPGSIPSKEKGEEFSISNVYVNVAAEEDDDNGEETEEKQAEGKLEVEEIQKDSPGGTAHVSNVYVNEGADTGDLGREESAL